MRPLAVLVRLGVYHPSDMIKFNVAMYGLKESPLLIAVYRDKVCNQESELSEKYKEKVDRRFRALISRSATILQ
eukprot:3646664-Amphidinium_carterae.2